MKGPPEPTAEDRKLQQDQDRMLQEQQQEEDQRKAQLRARELDLLHRQQGSGQNNGQPNGFGATPGAAPSTANVVQNPTPGIIQHGTPDGSSFQQPLDKTIGGG